MYPFKNDVAVLLLFFARPEQTKQVFDSIKEARPSKLFLYQDGPREGKNDIEGIMACRKIVEDIDWECEVHKNYLEKNQGCDPSGYLSRKWMFSYVDKGIILEDDKVSEDINNAYIIREERSQVSNITFRIKTLWGKKS